ncbi:MAG TPA: DUF1579 domain-containing protein [Phycisphaerales bacterium]|nr:DUF1579 domain-containing protein [Phycisphaerales bacterium]
MTAEKEDKMSACMAAARLAPEHELLKAFEGTWKSEVKMWMDPSADPMVSTGVMKNSLILGGRFIEHDYANDDGTFFGKGHWGYNTVDERWEGTWLDSMGTGMMIDRGRYDPASETWTMTGEMTDPASGQVMKKRSLLIRHDDDHHTMEMYFTATAGEHAGVETKIMEICYTRA